MSLNRQVALFGADQNQKPPDTTVAAGPGAVLEAVNDSLSVWSKTGNLLMVADLNGFFKLPSSQAFTDPRLLYDSQSGRWFLSGWSHDVGYGIDFAYLAVSATSDPTGNWYFSTLQSPTSAAFQPERPTTGVCDDKVVVSWNQTTNYYAGAETVIVQKSSLLAGSSSVNTASILLNPQYSLVPAQSLSPTTTCWMTINNADAQLDGSSTAPTLGVYAVTGTPDAGNVTLTDTELHLLSPTSPPPSPRQPSGTTNNFSTAIDDRLLSAVWENNVLWTGAAVSCQPNVNLPAQDCMRLWEVSTASATPSLLQDHVVDTLGVDEYYPAVSLDSSGDLFVSYTASSPTLFPGAYAVIAPASSPGTFTAPVTIEAGSASYSAGPTPYWGRYSAAAPDPSVPGAVWVAGEYAPADAGSGDWGTAAAELNLTAPPAQQWAVGAEGTDGQLWAQAPQLGSGWHALGGRIVAAPAVVAVPNPDGAAPSDPLFIGTGADQRLWIRSASAGWQPVGGARCIGGPAAVITGGTLTVACRGTDNALWYATAPWSGTGLPAFTGPWTSLGGVLSAGPAVAPVGGVLTFFVRGSTGQVYTRTVTAGYAATPWNCAGQPAAAAEAASADTIFACNAGGALWEAVNGGAGWSPATSLGGSLTGGPAVGAASLVTSLFAEGTDQAVWEHTPAGWTSLGGKITGGVGAAALN